jgi:hypothetical protein
VDPDDVHSIQMAITTITQDHDVWHRLHAAGPARADQFRWSRTATGLAEVFADVLKTREDR